MGYHYSATAMDGQPYLKPSNSESMEIRTRQNFVTGSSCKNASGPARSTTDSERVPLSRSELFLASLLESRGNKGLAFTVPRFESGETRTNYVAGNGFKIRKGRNH
jgi:hypothetical protein